MLVHVTDPIGHGAAQASASCFARRHDKRQRAFEGPRDTTVRVARSSKLKDVANRRALVRDLPVARLRLLDEDALAALRAESRCLIPAFETLERTLLGTCEPKTVARARPPNYS